MKKAIYSKLKSLYSNKGLSDKTLNGVAELLSKTVTKDDEIDAACAGVEGYLTAFQSSEDFLRGEAEKTKLEFDAYKKANPAKEPEKVEPPKTDDPNAAFQQQMVTMFQTLQQKIDGFSQERNSQTLAEKFNNLVKENKISGDLVELITASGKTFKDDADVQATFELLKGKNEVFEAKKINQQFTSLPPIERALGGQIKKDEVSPAMADLLKEREAQAGKGKPVTV